jgi:hypothetical protein
MCVCADQNHDLMQLLKEMLAGQAAMLAGNTASQTALFGAMKSGFSGQNKAMQAVIYNWLLTYTGTDMAGFIKMAIEQLLPEGEEKDMIFLLIEAAVAFMAKADKDKDRKVVHLLWRGVV